MLHCLVPHTYVSVLTRDEVAVIVGAMLQASSGCDSNMEASPSKEQERSRSHHAGFGRGRGGAVRRRGTPIPVLPPRVPTPVPSSDTRYVIYSYNIDNIYMFYRNQDSSVIYPWAPRIL
jgi:hypothetical protein